jgi:hypothetical protein
MDHLKKNDIVRFKPEFEDRGKEFDYILIKKPDGGRVKVMPLKTGLEFPPIQVVKTNWLTKKE